MNRLVFILFFFSTVFLFSCKKKVQKQDPDTPVNLLEVKARKVLYYDTYPSTTQALSQVTLLPQVQGYVTGIFFKEGSRVKKGQKLYEIDNRIYKANYDAALANLKVSQGNLNQATQDAGRYVYLNSFNAVAKQLLDHAVIAQQNAKNQVDASSEALKTAKANLNYSTIYAPFDGTMGFSQVKIGNVVSVGTTVLNTISTNDPIAVDFLITEKQLDQFEALERTRKNAPDSLFTLLLPNTMLYPYTGKISVIDRAVDPQTGSIRVRLVFPNLHDQLRAGMSCIVRVHNQEKGPQMLIPYKAVVEQMGEYFVFIARDSTLKNDSTAKNRSPDKGPRLMAFEKKVQLGQAIGGNVIVKKGIQEGERIVVDGVQTLHDGSLITTANKAAPSAAGGRGR